MPIIYFFLALLYATNATAASLSDAINSASVNNRTIRSQDYKLEATKSLKDEAKAEFLPNISASGQYGERKSNASIQTASTVNRNQYNKNQVEELKVEQPVFNGFGSMAKYDQANYKIQSATLQNRSKKQEIMNDVVVAYCDVLRYQDLVHFIDENKKLNEEIFNLAKKRKSHKIVDESDLIKFRYELASAETKSFEATSKLASANSQYLNLVGESPKALQIPQIKEETFDEKTTLQTALSNNPNLKSYYMAYLASKSGYAIEKSAFSPSVSVVGAVNKQKNALYLNGQDFINRSVYMNVSVPIFQKGVEYSNLAKAKNESSAAREDYEAVKDELLKNLKQSLAEYDFYLKLKKSNEELVDMAQNRVDILTKRFHAGTEDVMELLRAKVELNDRRYDFTNAQMDLIVTYYKIKALLGEEQI